MLLGLLGLQAADSKQSRPGCSSASAFQPYSTTPTASNMACALPTNTALASDIDRQRQGMHDQPGRHQATAANGHDQTQHAGSTRWHNHEQAGTASGHNGTDACQASPDAKRMYNEFAAALASLKHQYNSLPADALYALVAARQVGIPEDVVHSVASRMTHLFEVSQ